MSASARRLTPVIAVVVGFFVIAGEAASCSCESEPRPRLARAQAGFLGTVTTKIEDQGRPDLFRYTLAVERVYKGTLGHEVSVEMPTSSRDSCGDELEVGQRVGLLIHDERKVHRLSGCSLISEAHLEAGVRPYPAGSGEGRARLLVQGVFHSARLAVLDGRGSLLGWVFGTEDGVVSACPGGSHAIQGGDDLHVIRLRDLQVVRTVWMPGTALSAVRCLSPDGDRAVASMAFGQPGTRDGGGAPVLYVRGRRVVEMARVRSWPVIGPHGILVADHRVVRLIPYTSRRTRVLRRPGRGAIGADAAFGPDGRSVVIAVDRQRSFTVVRISAAGQVHSRRFRGSGHATWPWRSRIAVHRVDHTDVVDARTLRTRNRVRRWDGPGAVLGRHAWEIHEGRLERIPVRGRATTVPTPLDGGSDVVAVPGGPRVAVEPRAPTLEPPSIARVSNCLSGGSSRSSVGHAASA